MPIKYALFENNITADPNDHAAMVQIGGSADGDAEGDRGGSPKVQDIVDQGSTVNRPDILAVTAALKLACQRRAIRLGIADCGLMRGMIPADVAVPAVQSAIVNRQSAIGRASGSTTSA